MWTATFPCGPQDPSRPLSRPAGRSRLVASGLLRNYLQFGGGANVRAKISRGHPTCVRSHWRNREMVADRSSQRRWMNLWARNSLISVLGLLLRRGKERESQTAKANALAKRGQRGARAAASLHSNASLGWVGRLENNFLVWWSQCQNRLMKRRKFYDIPSEFRQYSEKIAISYCCSSKRLVVRCHVYFMHDFSVILTFNWLLVIDFGGNI